MTKNKTVKAQHALQLKITLRYIKPPIWRRILITDDFTLGELHSIIQRTMGWCGGHLHEFRVPRRGFGPPLRRFGAGEEGQEDENIIRLSEVLFRKRQVLLYEYDFGDGWLHEVLLEETLPLDANQVYPTCIAGAQACPPEDCGGVPGYYNILEALKKPNVAANAELLEWCGEYDPAAFDLESANRLTHRSQKNGRPTLD
jgi:pRiA4b ORF-3-like protein